MIRRVYLLLAILLISFVTAGCASDPVLHVIGVYEGKTPLGVDGGPWWAKCNDGQSAPPYDPTPSIECRRKYIDHQVEKEIVVNVSDNSVPIVLALMAYDKTLWKVNLQDGVEVRHVILAGYHAQRATGLPKQVPIHVYTHDPSPCDQCWSRGKYFYSYERSPAQLEQLTGLEATTFQGQYKGSEFSIVKGMSKERNK